MYFCPGGQNNSAHLHVLMISTTNLLVGGGGGNCGYRGPMPHPLRPLNYNSDEREAFSQLQPVPEALTFAAEAGGVQGGTHVAHTQLLLLQLHANHLPRVVAVANEQGHLHGVVAQCPDGDDVCGSEQRDSVHLQNAVPDRQSPVFLCSSS